MVASVAQSSTGTARKRGPGRPFQKGQSGNPGGRPRALLTRALADTLTPQEAQDIIAAVKAKALGGDLQATAMLWDRLEGKAVARNESGDPGAFDADLSDVDTAQLRAALKRVK